MLHADVPAAERKRRAKRRLHSKQVERYARRSDVENGVGLADLVKMHFVKFGSVHARFRRGQPLVNETCPLALMRFQPAFADNREDSRKRDRARLCISRRAT